ncbi:MAG: GNAT family N-acetyltransferase [Syntrophobacterales bacterium]|jgi:ribosomal protein S18 acetylase RimI-like enzyme|nr:GNAT family N-acetyltransferase [Syntrophobacterales bacterium]
MATAIHIREARAGELAEVEALVKTAYREFQPLMPPEVWQHWMANISETLPAPGGIVLVAERGGRLEGTVTFYPEAAQARQGQWPAGAGAIRLLAVRPGSRSRGAGVRLTRACLRLAREHRVAAIFLYTGTFMAAARHIYEKLGFQRAPEFDGHPGPIAYRLDLA